MSINHGIAAFILGVILLMGTAFAHDHANPALDGWYQGLKSPSGGSCCDGSDAASVLDPDWDTTGDPAYPYRVRLKASGSGCRRGALFMRQTKPVSRRFGQSTKTGSLR